MPANKLAAAALLASLALGGVALAPAAVAAPAARTATVSDAVPATAPAFNAGGVWEIFQSNGGKAMVNAAQDSAGNLTGTASVVSSTVTVTVAGTITSGVVDGADISFTIVWTNGGAGQYVGSLGADRRLSGTTVAITGPAGYATWYTARTF